MHGWVSTTDATHSERGTGSIRSSVERQHARRAQHASTRFVPLDWNGRPADVCRVLTWLAVALVVALVALVAIWLVRRWVDRASVRAVHRFGAHVNRFKLTRKAYIRDTLLANADIAAAVESHAREHRMDEAHAWRRVHEYVDEIVPFFNILAYYRFGYAASRAGSAVSGPPPVQRLRDEQFRARNPTIPESADP